MDYQKNILKNISISIIPFVFLLSIGLIAGDITLHQKVFKTLMIALFDCALLVILLINFLGNKEGLEKQRKYFIYFIAYFIFVFIQFTVALFSKEICYDKEYYIGNYILLIILSMSFFIFLNKLEDVKIGLLLVNVYVLIVCIWSIIEFINVDFKIANFRPKLSFGNTDYFSGYHIGLLPLAFISAFVWFDRKTKLSKNWFPLVLGVISVLGIIPLYFSQTRAALFGFYIGTFAIFIPSLIIMSGRIPSKIKPLLAILVVFVFLAAPILLLKFPPPIVEKSLGRLVKTMANPEFFLNDRYNGWEGGLRLFKQYPVFGAGLGSVYASSFKMHNLFYLYSDSNSFKHSHCEYVEVLGEAGIFGIIFFIALFGFVVISLMKIAYSKKYDKDFRYISMALAVGIVSMLIHQLFSLSFRMSVTMTAYFSLLGLGVFLISLRRSALLEGFTIKKSIFPEIFNGAISYKGKYILLSIMAVFTVLGIIGFSMTYRAEYNIRKALGSRSINEARYYFNKAVTIMPGNPYAWTQKYSVDFNYYQQLLKSFQNSQDYFRNVEQEFNVVKTDLDKLNGIIPGYQDVYSKYANLYLASYDYKIRKYSVTSNLSDYKDGIRYLYDANNHLTSSLNMNFLNENNHIIRLLLQNILNIESQYKDYVKDYAMARVYLDLGRGRRVVKEKIKINFTGDDKTSIVKEGEIYHVNISENDIQNIANSTKGIKNISELKTKLDSELKTILIYE